MERLYWGDLHAHCGISYGSGSLAGACANAREHLDFVSIVGHALWHDMPTDTARYGFIRSYHLDGFARLQRDWRAILRELDGFNVDGSFVTIPAYEWHSTRYGDYNVYYPHTRGNITAAADPLELGRRVASDGAMLIPHHTAYAPQNRSIEWSHFPQGVAPAVEIFSSHGCCEADDAPYPYYHTMGPRDSRTTARAGLDRGMRFGFVAGTDNHAGYPGAWGNGITGCFADNLSRSSLFDAITKRRTIAVTGDRMDIQFSVNGRSVAANGMARSGARHGSGRVVLAGSVRGLDRIAGIDIIKNGRVILRPELRPLGASGRLLRLEWGWGHDDVEQSWTGSLTLNGGEIRHVFPCFGAGQAFTAPSDEHATSEPERVLHRISRRDSSCVEFESVTRPNPSPRQPATGAIVFELHGDDSTRVGVRMNGAAVSYTLRELAMGSRAHFSTEWIDPAYQLHRVVDPTEYAVEFEVDDADMSSRTPADYYYLRVRQANGQYGWTSPIFVEH